MGDERMFPIQAQRGAAPHPTKIPWSVAELAYSVYSAEYGREQSLERLAERGGFGPGEMDMFLPDWRDRCSEVAALRKRVEELNRSNAAHRREHHAALDRAEKAERIKTEACDCEAKAGRKKSGQGSYKRFYCEGCLAAALDEARAEGRAEALGDAIPLKDLMAEALAVARAESAERERWECWRICWVNEIADQIQARGPMRGPEEE